MSSKENTGREQGTQTEDPYLEFASALNKIPEDIDMQDLIDVITPREFKPKLLRLDDVVDKKKGHVIQVYTYTNNLFQTKLSGSVPRVEERKRVSKRDWPHEATSKKQKQSILSEFWKKVDRENWAGLQQPE